MKKIDSSLVQHAVLQSPHLPSTPTPLFFPLINHLFSSLLSCFNVQSNTAKLIDLHRTTLSIVDVPVTAAELMLDHPGYVVSHFHRDSRISAMKADQSLFAGGIYLLISVGRVNGKLSESEMAVIESISGQRKSKRRSSKVLPVVTGISGDGCHIGPLNYRIKQWKPALEPIYEGISTH